jgi:hypothetical protein
MPDGVMGVWGVWPMELHSALQYCVTGRSRTRAVFLNRCDIPIRRPPGQTDARHTARKRGNQRSPPGQWAPTARHRPHYYFESAHQCGWARGGPTYPPEPEIPWPVAIMHAIRRGIILLLPWAVALPPNSIVASLQPHAAAPPFPITSLSL